MSNHALHYPDLAGYAADQHCADSQAAMVHQFLEANAAGQDLLARRQTAPEMGQQLQHHHHNHHHHQQQQQQHALMGLQQQQQQQQQHQFQPQWQPPMQEQLVQSNPFSQFAGGLVQESQDALAANEMWPTGYGLSEHAAYGSNQSFDFSQPPPQHHDYGLSQLHPQQYASPPQQQQQQQQPQSTRAAPVPIPAQVQPRSSISDQQASSGPSNPTGPMSSTISMPARPKPGRKPIQHENKEDKSDKRRAQNRDSQRRFRDKRQVKLADATEELGALKDQMRDQECDFERRLEESKQKRRKMAAEHEQKVEGLQKRLREKDAENQRLKEELSRVGSGQSQSRFHGLTLPTTARSNANLPAQPQAPTPTEEFASREIDFTTFDNLGREPQPQTQSQPYATASASRGPGSCDACRADETGEMRRKCMELSQNTTYDTTMTNTDDGRVGGFDSVRGSFADGAPTGSNKLAPLSSQTMSCSDFLTEYQQQAAGRFRPLSDAFRGRVIHGYQAPEGPIDLDHAEAAAVLSSMSRK